MVEMSGGGVPIDLPHDFPDQRLLGTLFIPLFSLCGRIPSTICKLASSEVCADTSVS